MPLLRSGMFIGWLAINISLQRSERHVAREERKTRRSRGAKNTSLERSEKPVARESERHVAREERKTRRSRGAKNTSLERSEIATEFDERTICQDDEKLNDAK